MMRPLMYLFSALLMMGACTTKKAVPSDHLQELAQLMTGSFNSGIQAAADSSYYNISLHMYPIWTQRKGEHWIYVEQALNSRQDKPYRQRVYQVRSLGDDRYESIVYTLPNPEKYIGKWTDNDLFAQIRPEDLSLREGCTVYLKRTGSRQYTGSTKPNTCKSSLRGASYATSAVTVSPGKIESWDQGFDADGQQVWGAEKGGYVFLKN